MIATSELGSSTLPAQLSDETEAWLLLERLRWEGAPVCPHCGTKDKAHYFLASRSGQRTTRAGNPTHRRLWKCRDKGCRKQFSVLVGTVLEDSKVPLSTWLLALHLCCATPAIAAKELERRLGVTYATAWSMRRRLREAMAREPLASLMATPRRDTRTEDAPAVTARIDQTPGEAGSRVVPPLALIRAIRDLTRRR